MLSMCFRLCFVMGFCFLSLSYTYPSYSKKWSFISLCLTKKALVGGFPHTRPVSLSHVLSQIWTFDFGLEPSGKVAAWNRSLSCLYMRNNEGGEVQTSSFGFHMFSVMAFNISDQKWRLAMWGYVPRELNLSASFTSNWPARLFCFAELLRWEWNQKCGKHCY